MKRKERLQYQVLTAVLAGIVSVSTWGGQYGIAQAAEGEETSTDKQTVAMADYGDEDVVVTAAAMPTKIAATPANVTVITAQEIEDNHYKTVGEALEQVNGVTVAKLGGGSQELVTLNGDARVVIMVDGQRLNNDQGAASGRASADPAMFPMMGNIEKIEVVKGGASALYGSDAVGGVINIITKKAMKNQTELDLAYGSKDMHKFVLKNQGAQGDFSWQIAAGLEGRTGFKYKYAGEEYDMKNSDTKNHDFFMRLDQKLSDRDSLQFNFMHKSIYSGIYKCTGAASAIGTDKYMQEVFNNTSLTYNFKENTPAPGYVRYFFNNKNETFGNQFGTQMQGIDYQNGWQLDKDNVLIAGAELHWSKSSNSKNGYDGKNIDNQAFYVQDTVTAGKWTLVPGVRMDHHSKYGSHFTPKLAINYQADNKTQVYANYGRVFKAPTADDLFYSTREDYGVWGITEMLGNPNLKAESGWSTTFGVNHKFSEKIDAGISYFSSEIANAIDWKSSYNAITNTTTYSPVNLDREKRQGLELTFNQKIDDNWSYNLGYSYIHSEKNGQYNPNNIMPNGYKVGVKYKNRDFSAILQGKVGSGVDEKAYVNRGYNLWNLTFNYDFNKNVTGYAQILNMTNSEHFVNNTAYGSYYPAAGRTFMVGVNVKF